MRHILYMAWRYLRFHWVKTAVLIASISLILFIPLGLQVIVSQAASALTARADATPLLIGAKGSAIDLTLSALYFTTPATEPLPYRELSAVRETGLALGIPLTMRYKAAGFRIVGTSLDYFDFRQLKMVEGRPMAVLGECVLGDGVARSLDLGPDSSLFSSPATAFDVAGSTPLKMKVVGVLAPGGGADDDAVFVDVKTAWVISGLAHGHIDLSSPEAESGVLRREENSVVANASVLPYTEITARNIDSFHFHGDPDQFPIDALLVVPNDRRSMVLLRGRYEERSDPVQILVPRNVIADLMGTVLSVRDFVIMGSLGVGAATLATAVLVFVLSIRLRKREISTIRKIGGTERRLKGILAAEILLVVGLSGALTGALVLMLSRYGTVLALAIIG
ncbi:MAG: ABC transporter permease [Bacteroidota bacterium]